MYIKKSGIDRKVMDEKELRRQTRKQLDVMSGLTHSKGAMRADFKLCRENDKLYKDYRRFKDKGDREKINKELEQTKKEFRNG